MKLELPSKWLSALLEKEILSALLKHKRIPARVALLALMIIWIVSIIVPILQLYNISLVPRKKRV